MREIHYIQPSAYEKPTLAFFDKKTATEVANDMRKDPKDQYPIVMRMFLMDEEER